MNIEITSASRKEQRAEDVPAAVYVITHDDIRRSGMTSVPELLRLVPGVQVAQINANKWAVSVRGFNSLALEQAAGAGGRPLGLQPAVLGGVFWDTEDLMLDDIDRIEVIRGPGGAVWGANAVNGVINIITRPAADTHRLLMRAGAGTFDRSSVGGSLWRQRRPGAYRTYAQLSTHGDSRLPHRSSPPTTIGRASPADSAATGPSGRTPICCTGASPPDISGRSGWTSTRRRRHTPGAASPRRWWPTRSAAGRTPAATAPPCSCSRSWTSRTGARRLASMPASRWISTRSITPASADATISSSAAAIAISARPWTAASATRSIRTAPRSIWSTSSRRTRSRSPAVASSSRSAPRSSRTPASDSTCSRPRA